MLRGELQAALPRPWAERLVGSLPLAVPASTNTRLRMSPVPANRWIYSKRSLRPKPPIVWLSFSTNFSPGC